MTWPVRRRNAKHRGPYRLTQREVFKALYPMRQGINIRFNIFRKLPIPKGASWAAWFRRKVKAKQ